MPRINLFVAGMLVLAGLALSPGLTAAAPLQSFPETIALPDGFRPEGVATGYGTTIYAGSLATGDIYGADIRTGQGSILVPPQEGRAALGLEFDERTGYLFVAGGPTGSAYVYDTSTGATVGVFVLTTAAEPFVNDVVVTPEAAFFTDSFRPVLYRLPLLPDGQLPGAVVVEELGLGGDFVFVPGAFNSNGIEATPSGDALVVVNSTLGSLYRVDPASGDATLIDLSGGSAAFGDGLLLIGQTLYVVQNFLNQISVVNLDPDLTSGAVVQILTDPNLDIPATVAGFGASLYAVNARFSTPPTPDTDYWITQLPRLPIHP